MLSVTAAAQDAGNSRFQPEFKISAAYNNGALASEVLRKHMGFVISASVGYSLSDTTSIVGGLGYRVLSGDQYLAKSYEVPGTNVNTGYLPNTTYSALNQKHDGGGFEFSCLYRMDLLGGGLYVQGGLRLSSYKLSTNNFGADITTDANGAMNGANTIIKTISYIADTSTIGPAIVLGLGYRMAPQHALEFNLSSLRAEGEDTGTKSGIAFEIGYSIRF
jgi:hypothetical protein